MDYIYMSIGSVLKDRRIKLNIKQEDIAEQMKVTVQTVSKWERDITEPKANQVSKLSQILKISEKEICQGTIDKSDINGQEFIRRVGVLMKHVPHIEMLYGMHEYIPDQEGFLNMLAEASEFPYELFDQGRVESSKEQLEWAESGQIQFKDEETKELFIEHHKRIVEGKKSK
ncbi:HTH-type transcriptional regulator, cell division transcriptional repressor [Vibrio crassostreae]|nr:helix-turn-helix protein [Vibrio crassostreae]CAK2196016.1 HTH-type transcriptional regulator, cell division transcriptional repressor [Vibrio crassostreae]CAK2314040.1 HTH-type transcriptional regulator, cell division transcriptional repressor [Vibrio crassostreae]CAK2376235.1 HTH-type transcriptional regulator, cell division transcriptional repressor [Vibrio crassostreae]CAK2431739.1 HTH-type transcriptional regulator, cell division transcriptional repressor [Vibrio crassostreae]